MCHESLPVLIIGTILIGLAEGGHVLTSNLTPFELNSAAAGLAAEARADL